MGKGMFADHPFYCRKGYDKSLGKLTEAERSAIALARNALHDNPNPSQALIAQKRFRVKAGSIMAYEEIPKDERPPPIYCNSSRSLPEELRGLDQSAISQNVNHPDQWHHVKGYVFVRATQEQGSGDEDR
jgi:hypothetical protein